jgi:hypothetical protein
MTVEALVEDWPGSVFIIPNFSDFVQSKSRPEEQDAMPAISHYHNILPATVGKLDRVFTSPWCYLSRLFS